MNISDGIRSLKNLSRPMKLYIALIAVTAVALSLSNKVLSNYFKEAYDVTAFLRGVIEFPRETPGLICLLTITLFSFLGDYRTALIAQLLSVIGITALGLFTPAFSVMLIFIFINSMGMHLFMPLQDSIGLELVKGQPIGTRMGQFKGIVTAFSLLGGLIVFFGFRFGFFSFTRPLKGIFLLSGAFSFAGFILLIFLIRAVPQPKIQRRKMRFTFRKEYRYYYLLVVLFGVQKQIMMVYGPWVLVDLLDQPADTIAILAIIGSFIGIFFIPALGRWMDRLGLKKMMYVDALSFIGVYLFYGFLSGGYASGLLPTTGLFMLLGFGVYIFDQMSAQMGMIRTVYLREIAVDPSEITTTLSLGMSLDHAVSILIAFLGGIIWTEFGPQYVFYMAAAFSLGNLWVARRVKLPRKN